MKKKSQWCFRASLAILVLFLTSCARYGEVQRIKPIIDESRLQLVQIDSKGSKQQILDTYEESVCNILAELRRSNFEIFEISSYSARNKVGGGTPSMHAYASAIDINPNQNPYYNVVTGVKICGKNEEGYEDNFLNRNIVRPGMVTDKEVEIFARNGFTIWGGMWRQPMDYMHFQTTLAIAKIVNHLSPKEAKIFWKAYLKNPKKIAKSPFFSGDIEPEKYNIWDFLSRIDNILNAN